MYNFPPKNMSTLNFTFYTEDGDTLLAYAEGHQAFDNISRATLSYIEIYYDDRADYLMQFNFYLRLDPELHTSYVVGHSRPYVVPKGYETAIHYKPMPTVHKDSRHAVVLNDPLNTINYLSFSTTLSCVQNFSYKFEIIGRLSYHTSIERDDLKIYNYLLFHTPYSYFKSMDRYLVIATKSFPPCDVVVNIQQLPTFQTFPKKKTNKFQKICNTGFLQVSKKNNRLN